MSKHVLLVDDDQGIREVLSIILEENGYLATSLSHATSIETMLLKVKPDLLIMDMWIAGEDGCEVVKRIKDNPVFASIPVIIVSAENDGEVLAKKCGADGFISKPFEMEEFLQKIQLFIS